jgi:hypothetical protein
LCVSRNKEKQFVSKFGIGMEHHKDSPDPGVPVARSGNYSGTKIPIWELFFKTRSRKEAALA